MANELNVSPQRILVMGGTSFFGRELVRRLVAKGHRVTVATRGNTSLPPDMAVVSKIIERHDVASLRHIFQLSEWDLVYDQICFSPDDALVACDVFSGRVGKYIVTSTAFVYPQYGSMYREDSYQPGQLELKTGGRDVYDYRDGKRLAEVAFEKKGGFPMVFARIPIVVGPNDPTGRLNQYLDAICNTGIVKHPNAHAPVSYISSHDAARFLEFCGENAITGAFNVQSGILDFRCMVNALERALNRTIVIERTTDPKESAYYFEQEFTIDCTRSLEAGFCPESDLEYLVTKLAVEHCQA